MKNLFTSTIGDVPLRTFFSHLNQLENTQSGFYVQQKSRDKVVLSSLPYLIRTRRWPDHPPCEVDEHEMEESLRLTRPCLWLRFLNLYPSFTLPSGKINVCTDSRQDMDTIGN